jgi:hypothetical protein
MTKRDTMMFSLYLIIIGMGAVIAEHHPIAGIIQIVVGAAFFSLRLYNLSE